MKTQWIVSGTLEWSKVEPPTLQTLREMARMLHVPPQAFLRVVVPKWMNAHLLSKLPGYVPVEDYGQFRRDPVAAGSIGAVEVFLFRND